MPIGESLLALGDGGVEPGVKYQFLGVVHLHILAMRAERAGFTPVAEEEKEKWGFSHTCKAKALKLYSDSMIANGDKGYRSVLATQGVTEGTYYYELTVLNSSSENLNLPSNPIPPNAPMLEPLVPTHMTMCYETHNLKSILESAAHTRIGFSTLQTDLELPIGSDLFSYSYRDLDGSAFHQSRRRPYSHSYGPNDVIGCMIKLNPQKPKIKGRKEEGPVVSEGSCIRFFKNEEDLGTCFMDIYEGTYYPAVALYQFARVELATPQTLKYPDRLSLYSAQSFT